MGDTDRPKHWGKKKQKNASNNTPKTDPPPGKSTNVRGEGKRKK